jgi:hypothetical protein
MRVYAGQIPRKYSNVSRQAKDEADENERIYSTNEGDVLLSISGTRVFISEGFELGLARKLRDSILNAQPEGPLQIAGEHELSLSMARTFASLGTIRAGDLERYTFQGSAAPEGSTGQARGEK